MNPIPVVIDKVLLPLELYSVPLPPPLLSIYGAGEYFRIPNSRWVAHHFGIAVAVLRTPELTS